MPQLTLTEEFHSGADTVVSIPSADVPRALIIASPETEADLIQTAEAKGFRQISTRFWQLEDIRAGLPAVFKSTAQAFIPQMLTLDELGEIGFQKGCYTGQEVVARTHAWVP